MAVRVSSSMSAAYEFACHSAACRPPTSGGTGGSSGGPSRATLKRQAAARAATVAAQDARSARVTMNRLAQKKDRTPAEEAQLQAAVARSRQSGSRTPTGDDRVKIRK